LIGIAGAWATYALAKGKEEAFRNGLIILVIGTVLGAVQFIASMQLRGEATPANVKFLVNALTLIVFLVIRIPSIWQHVDFSAQDDQIDGATAGGFAAIVAGLIVFSVPTWAGSSHTYQGTNWVLVLQRPLEITSLILLIGGALLLGWVGFQVVRQELAKANREGATESLPRDI
jgi:hypothetical protein